MSKASHSSTFPVSGDAFSIANFNNAFNGLHQGDFAPLRPRAHAVADMSIMVSSGLVENYYSQCYASGDFPIAFASGDISFSAPASNPRIDLVYTSGDRLWKVTGTEAASPAIPRFPSGDGTLPISLVYHRTTETKIVNFEDKDSNPTHGYIYRDVRPILTVPVNNLPAFKVGSFTRDLSIATGNQSVIGVGFKPRSVIFLSLVNGTTQMSLGLDDDATSLCIFNDSANWVNAAASVYIYTSAIAQYSGTILSFDNTGFTISWVKTGSPTGTVQVNYLALR